MGANVRFVRTTKEKWLEKVKYDPMAIYFAMDTGELFVGSLPFTGGLQMIESDAELPDPKKASKQMIYYCLDKQNGYVISADSAYWVQVLGQPQNSEGLKDELKDYINSKMDNVVLDGGQI